MNDNFRVMLASDDDHEKVYAEIYFGKRFVALVSRTRAGATALVEFPGLGLDEEQIVRKVDLEGFRIALDLAEQRLLGEAG